MKKIFLQSAGLFMLTAIVVTIVAPKMKPEIILWFSMSLYAVVALFQNTYDSAGDEPQKEIMGTILYLFSSIVGIYPGVKFAGMTSEEFAGSMWAAGIIFGLPIGGIAIRQICRGIWKYLNRTRYFQVFKTRFKNQFNFFKVLV